MSEEGATSELEPSFSTPIQSPSRAPIPVSPSRNRSLKSTAWDSFTRVTIGGVLYGQCKLCGNFLKAIHGTKSLHQHKASCWRKRGMTTEQVIGKSSRASCLETSLDRIPLTSDQFHSRIPQSLSPIDLSNSHHNGIRAVAGNGMDNLDHLQRANKQQLKQQQQQQQQKQQPKKRAAQVAPIGSWDRFPPAKTLQQTSMESTMEDNFVYSGGRFPTVKTVQQMTMDSMTEDPLSSGRWPVAAQSQTEVGGYSWGRIPWEMKERETEYKMRFDMPGMRREDVKVWVEEKMLVVKAEKFPKKKNGDNGEVGGEEEEEWSANSYGRYSTRIALPDNVQFEKIKAEVKDGVLYVTLPKACGVKILDINVQ